MRRYAPLSLALAAALALSACGGETNDDPGSPTDGTGGNETVEPTTPPDEGGETSEPPANGGLGEAGVPEVQGEFREAPLVIWPMGSPPEGLQVKVLHEGDGPEVKPGDFIVADYIGQVWAAPEPFNNTWDMGGPIGFSLDRVIRGWSEGIPGTKVGSRIEVVIPSELGYPDGQPGAGINPGDTLVFVIDVLATATPETAAGDPNATDNGKLAELPVNVTGDIGSRPSISLKDGAAAPTEVTGTVIAEGTGEPLAAGGMLLVAYEVISFDGTPMGSTWDAGDPEAIALGSGTAFDEFIGAPAGSRAVLMMPSMNDNPAIAAVVEFVGYAPPRDM